MGIVNGIFKRVNRLVNNVRNGILNYGESGGQITVGVSVPTGGGGGGGVSVTPTTPVFPPQEPALEDEPIIIKGWRQLPERSIVGLRDGYVVQEVADDAATMTDYTDFDSYPDGAILRLVNESGDDVVLNGLSIRGLPVMCHKNAYVWERKDDESIEANGEASLEISNSYMIDPEQIEDLGDYLQKAFDGRPVYGLSIPGCHYEYEVGDVWHLSLSYTIQGQTSECELIDTDVEIESIAFSRSVGGIGETRLVCMPPMDAWTKTTSTRSKLISAGMAQWLNNRGNQVLVAASTYTGQADYYCDGTADNAEIQAAIDSMDAKGGGAVLLTEGIFNVAVKLTLGSNITLAGAGLATQIRFSTSLTTVIDLGRMVNNKLSNLYINGNDENRSAGMAVVVAGSGSATNAIVENVNIKNIIVTGTAAGATIGISMFAGSEAIISKCKIQNITASNEALGIDGGSRCDYNYVDSITTTGAGVAYGISASLKCQQNTATNCTTAGYNNAFADAAGTQAAADTAAGGYNS